MTRLNKTIDEQGTEQVVFYCNYVPQLAKGFNMTELRKLGEAGYLSFNRMAEDFVAFFENTKRCTDTNQKGFDLQNKTEVKTGNTCFCPTKQQPDRYKITISGLTNKENSDHIIAIIYNDVLECIQVLNIPNKAYRDKAIAGMPWNIAINKDTGDINGSQKYIGFWQNGKWVYESMA
jgi:hypothetical protein|tara:strand:+ start:183 stop:713 length:531 start_codon:yes stop_codon:yes gene_type:complete